MLTTESKPWWHSLTIQAAITGSTCTVVIKILSIYYPEWSLQLTYAEISQTIVACLLTVYGRVRAIKAVR